MRTTRAAAEAKRVDDRQRDQDGRVPGRRHARVRRSRPVVLQPVGQPQAFGRLEIVGGGGALVRCRHEFSVGERLDMLICLAGGVIPAKVRVVYAEENGDGNGWAVGVEFRYLGEGGAELLRSVMERTD